MSDQPNDTSDGGGNSSKAKPNFSPFPYGSPLQLQTSFSGSPGQKLLLSSFSRSNRSSPVPNGDISNPRLRGQDLYGGAVMFGGGPNSSFRRNRLLSASPYSSALRNRQTEKVAARARAGVSLDQQPPSSLPSTAPSSPAPSPTSDGMSSTARLILDTLDKMSTPILDARKIPTPVQPRAEKRKLIEDELNCSLKSPARSRRPRLGGGPALSGPPLRRNYSPAPAPLSGAIPIPPPTIGAQPGSRLFQPSEDKQITSTNSFKIKTKVTEMKRSKVDLITAPDPPPFTGSTVPLLQVESMPVFNISTAETSSSVLDKSPKSNGISGPSEDDSEEEVIEKNNNKSSKKRSLDDNSSEIPNKKVTDVTFKISPTATITSNKIGDTSKIFPNKIGTTSILTPSLPKSTISIPSLPTSSTSSASFAPSLPTSSIVSVPVCSAVVLTKDTTVPTPNPPVETACVTPRRYTFSTPQVVVSETEVSEASFSFTFCPPTVMSSSTVAKQVPNVVNFNISSMPDVTNNLLKKSTKDSIKGSSSCLPDITASTGFGGFGAAKELKVGSVMDILGNKKS